MAKPISKRQWEEIKKDFEYGMSQADLRKKYDLSPSTLGTKIKRDGWRLSHEQASIISEFKESSAKISESFHNANEIQRKEILERVQTILEDNEIIQNNRKLLKAFQGKILNGLKDGKYEKPSDIKAGTSALKDIENIANPKPDTVINNANLQNNSLTLEDFYNL